MHPRTFLTSLLALLTLAACQDKGGEPATLCTGDFDQPALFANVAGNIILPAYESLSNRLADLQARAQAFADNPGAAALAPLRDSYREAYLSWQGAAIFEFGPAAGVFLRNSLNNFPLNVDQLEANIRSGSYDFDDPSDYDKGLPALDYLLFAGGEAAVVARFSTDAQADAYRRYLTGVVSDMAERVEATRRGWAGGYRASFVQNTGTAAGSSLSLIINNLNEHYETIKRDRIGIPSGVVTLGFTNPDKVEAYHSGLSAELALEATRASRQLYLGAAGPGLDDLLNSVKAEKNGRPLDALIREQYEAAIQALVAVPPPLSAAVDNNGALVQKAYTELTKQVVNLKTDLPSVLCVAITYIDNPSDSD